MERTLGPCSISQQGKEMFPEDQEIDDGEEHKEEDLDLPAAGEAQENELTHRPRGISLQGPHSSELWK